MTWLPLPSGWMRDRPSGAPWNTIHSSPSPTAGASEDWVDAALGSLGGFSLADGLLQATPTRSTRPRTSWAYGCCPRLHSDLAPLSA
jgi:hypothetical protein